MKKKDILISKTKLVEEFKKFRKARNGENSNFATVTLPDLDKMIKASIIVEEKPKENGDSDK